MFKHIKDNKGFSLIELMVVLAIIGILAAIAVPSYQGFQKRAKQAEAKQVLGGIYIGQKAYHVEHSTYHADLETIGLEHEPLKHYTNVGFKSSGSSGAVTNCGTKCAFTTGSGFTAGASLVTCSVDDDEFNAGATGDSSEVGTGFQIDESKTIGKKAINATTGVTCDALTA